MKARWPVAALVVVTLLFAIDGAPSAETLAAFTSAGSASGAVTAGRWTSTGPPCREGSSGAAAPAATAGALGSGQRGNACGPPSPFGPPWPPGYPLPPGPPPGRPPHGTTLEARATATPARR